jgi:hypothetical protein
MSISSVKTGEVGTSLLAGNTAELSDFESIATVSVTSASTVSATFSNIPSTYAHLQIRGISRTTGAGSSAGNLRLTLNSDTGSNYSSHYVSGDGAAVSTTSFNSGTYSWAGGWTNNVDSTAMSFAGTIIDILDYANTNKYTTVRTFSGVSLNNTSGAVALISGLWMNTSAVTTVTLQILTGSGYDLSQYSHLALYGIKAAS